MRIIKVPPNTLPVNHEDMKPPVVKEENFFWFMLTTILKGTFARLSAIDTHKNIEFYKEFTEQSGATELRIRRESDYELLKDWVDNWKVWPGTPEDVDALFVAVRDAEKAKEKPKDRAPG
jgi:hypothetical protein